MQKKHQAFKLSKCGIFISQNVFLGEGLVELKCAVKFWHQDPNSKEVIEKLPYLVYRFEGAVEMNKKHEYYSQVQFQMRITGKRWCHFVVFTVLCLSDEVSPLVLKVDFDQHHFMKLLAGSTECWFEYILPELVSGRLKGQLQATQVLGEVQNHNSTNESFVLDHMSSLSIDASNPTGFNSTTTCPICHTVCKEQENVKKFMERSIACDNCNSWFHFGCIKMTRQKVEELEGSNWYCQLCSKE